jgi:tripeptide aminopeptidase
MTDLRPPTSLHEDATLDHGDPHLRQLLALLPATETIVKTAVAIQQIPSPTFGEGARAAEVLRRFKRLPLDDVSQDEVGNVYACRRGRQDRPGILLAAHLDTVFDRETDLTVRQAGPLIYGPGIGDNSLGVAALLHLAEAVEQAALPNAANIWYVTDVCEEGMGNLRGMRAAIDRLGDGIGKVIAVEGTGFGRIYHRAIGVTRLRVEVHGPGGHSWADYGTPSAVHHLAELALAVTRLAIPEEPRTTLNIGVIEGGTTVNAIAERGTFLLDLRSESQAALDALVDEARRAIDTVPRTEGISVTVQLVGKREAGMISQEHGLARAAAEALEAVGATVVWGSGSTDANVPLALGIPAVCIGITTGGNAHRHDEYIETTDIHRGMEALARLLWSISRAGS